MKRLIFYIIISLCGALPALAQDYTSKVKNTQAGWGGTGTYTAGSITCAEYYTDYHFYHNTFRQTVTGLPVGVYEAEVYFNASCAAWSCEPVANDGDKGLTHFYMNDAEIDVPVYNIKAISSPTLHTISNIHVTDGTLRLGARNDREGANWHIVRLKRLTYLGLDAQSLYFQVSSLLREARAALTSCTSVPHAEALRSAIADAMEATPLTDVETLQTLTSALQEATTASTAFESEKSTVLKGILTSLEKFQTQWNNGTDAAPSLWEPLLSAVVNACIAKDSETDLEAMSNAKAALDEAMNIITNVAPAAVWPAKSTNAFTPDGRAVGPAYRGIVIEGGRKSFRP